MSLQCCICLSGCNEDEDGNDVPWSSLSCGHIFHSACIERALAARKLCPNCRKPARGNANRIFLPFAEAGDSDVEAAVANAAVEGGDASVQLLALQKRHKNQIAAKNEEIAGLRVDVSDFQRQNETLSLRVAIQDRELKELGTRVQVKVHEINNLTKENKAQHNEIKNLKLEVKKNKEHILRTDQYIERYEVALNRNLTGSDLEKKIRLLCQTPIHEPLNPQSELVRATLEDRNQKLKEANRRTEQAVAERYKIEAGFKEQLSTAQSKINELLDKIEALETATMWAGNAAAMGNSRGMSLNQNIAQQTGNHHVQKRPPVYGGAFTRNVKRARSLEQPQQRQQNSLDNNSNHQVLKEQHMNNQSALPNNNMVKRAAAGHPPLNSIPDSQEEEENAQDYVDITDDEHEGDYIEIESSEEDDYDADGIITEEGIVDGSNNKSRTTNTLNNNSSSSDGGGAPLRLVSLHSAGPSRLGVVAAPGRSFLRSKDQATTGLENTGTFVVHGPDGKGGVVNLHRDHSGKFFEGSGMVASRGGGKGGPVKNTKKARQADARGSMKLVHFFDRKGGENSGASTPATTASTH